MLKVRCERPDCGGDELRISERNGVEIDYCAVCRGVWLDRGELDKIIERSAQQPMSGGYVPPQQPPQYQQTVPPPQKRYDDDYDDDYRRDGDYDKKKRKSWLGELFDF
ncbi:MAG: zf-TFIIB domain-containing protein [bacterium]|nr:zf-TFIIB domain-containing protein [bacterium]